MKYFVEVSEVHKSTYEIESEQPLSREELLVKAQALIEEGVDDICLEYSHTLDSDVWTTRTEKGDFVT